MSAKRSRPASTVTVTLSEGRSPLRVPQVIGEPAEQALNELQQVDLQARVEEVDSDRPKGEVIAQDPASDTGAEPGAMVTLQVSEGPPTIRCRRLRPACRDAIRALTGAGFEVGDALGTRAGSRAEPDRRTG